MIINCFLSYDCDSEQALRENIARSLSLENIHASVYFHRVDREKAQELGLTGSPSIFINDKELQPQKTGGFS